MIVLHEEIMNYRKRIIGGVQSRCDRSAFDAIGEDEARKNLSVTPVRNGRLALIPDGGEKETLCYEYECEAEGTYFIYIDALTGAETEILYVIDDVDMGESMM